MAEINFPTERISLPSGGKLYPKDSALASGEVELRYLTARDEDILTNASFIEKGVVVDKLLQSLIADKDINYADLLIGDKNALLLAARILGYGSKYTFEWGGETHEIDLSQIENKELHPDFVKATENRFTFTCPTTGTVIEFKLLTHADEQMLESELRGLKKLYKEGAPELSTRIKYMILSVDGESDRAKVRSWVDNAFLARDSREFRKYIAELQPDVDMKFYPDNGPEEGVQIPINTSFLWPDLAN